MLRNRKDFDQPKLGGVIAAAEAEEIELGRFTELQNWIPGDLNSLKKKRGVAAFTSDELSPQTPGSQCDACPNDTIPDEFEDLEGFCYEYTQGVPSGQLSGNCAGNMNFVEPGAVPEFIVWAADRSGFGTDYTSEVGASASQVLRGLGDTITEVDRVPLPSGDSFTFFGQQSHSGLNGKSDELCYLIAGSYNIFGGAQNQDVLAYFNWDDQTVYLLNKSAMGSGDRHRWAKRGNNFYFSTVPGFTNQIARWDMTAANNSSFATIVSPWTGNITELDTSESYFWVYGASGLERCNPTTLAVLQTYSISPGMNGFSVVSDDFIYFWRADGGGGLDIYYFIPSTETLTFIGNTEPSSTSGCFSLQTGAEAFNFHYQSGHFYVNPIGLQNDQSTVRFGPIFCPGTDSAVIGA
jgi:hypothetical protein